MDPLSRLGIGEKEHAIMGTNKIVLFFSLAFMGHFLGACATAERDDAEEVGEQEPKRPSNEPIDHYEYIDHDGDGVEDSMDTDALDGPLADLDGDGTINQNDDFPTDPNESSDSDGDGVGDNSDPDNSDGPLGDLDSDGSPNQADVFPSDPNEDTDTDGDGIGDNADSDDFDGPLGDPDGDNVPNQDDDFPTDPNEDTDTDGDGIGNNSDPDNYDGPLVTKWTGNGVGSDIKNPENWSNGLPTLEITGYIINGSAHWTESDVGYLDGSNIIVSGSGKITTGNAQMDFDNGTLTIENGGGLLIDYRDVDLGTDNTGFDTIINLNKGGIIDRRTLELGSHSIINQNGGSAAFRDVYLHKTSSVYNLSKGTLYINRNLVIFDGYINFTSVNSGELTVNQNTFEFETLINAGKIRINNMVATVADFVIDNSFDGQVSVRLKTP